MPKKPTSEPRYIVVFVKEQDWQDTLTNTSFFKQAKPVTDEQRTKMVSTILNTNGRVMVEPDEYPRKAVKPKRKPASIKTRKIR